MKKLLTIVFVFSFLATNAQQKQKETKEERQERYIQEGNPFKEFGYQPKIATLSKGKYREFFTDTIVQIGSFTYNRLSKQITGVLIIENKGFSEADLRPDLVSRWMSPDPLSDEFPSWSPYNFVMNNPIRFIDPEGLAPQDVIIKGDDAQAAFDQLQASTSLELDFNDGKVTVIGGQASNAADTKLQTAIDDHSVEVTINTTDKNYAVTSDGVSRTFDGDAFFGSNVNENGVVVTNQLLNVETAATIDAAQNGQAGTVTKHAVLESYIAAKENPGAGDSKASPQARNSAHKQANALDPNVNINNSIIQTNINRRKGTKTRINTDGNGNVTPLFTVKLRKLGKQ